MKNLKAYDALVSSWGRDQRKGKTVPYTSANGYMYSFINKAGELGIRLSKEDQEKFCQNFESGPFHSHGAQMKDYVLVPDSALLNHQNELIAYLQCSFDFVNSLPKK